MSTKIISLTNTLVSAIQKKKYDADKNSIQHIADQSSDYFDFLGDNKVGVVLDEHRRCEESIVAFSNNHVYANSLQIIKKDTCKVFLGSSLCMIDIRGTCDKNLNQLEVKICSNIVEKLVSLYGDEYKNNIGIITPFKNQSSKFDNTVKHGTVHSYQGQEKEVIILSLVVDDQNNRGKLNFIGNTPNFLNVAFTRAKTQLIIVGNYEVCASSNNYLSKAMNTVKECGRLFSLFEPDLINDDSNTMFKNQFLSIVASDYNKNDSIIKIVNKYSHNGIIDGSTNHNHLLHDLLANFQLSARIVTPWIRHNVVDGALFTKISTAIINKKTVDIFFGYNYTKKTIKEIDEIIKIDNCNSYNKEKDIATIRNLSKLLKDSLHYIPPIHTKILIIDDKIMIIGSHNWLSNSGGLHDNQKDEISCLVSDKDAINYIKRRYN